MGMITQQHRDDFLWFSYFGVTKTECEADTSGDTALNSCISRAYLDLNRTLKYTWPVSELEKPKMIDKKTAACFIKAKGVFREMMVQKIKAGIVKLMNEKQDFDKWHKEMAGSRSFWSNAIKTAEKEADGINLFKEDPTVGQAQKWLNMSLKNMLVMGLWDKKLEKYIPQMHIAVDPYIMDAAAVQKGSEIESGFYPNVCGLGVPKTEKLWSQITDYDNEYLKFQNDIRKALCGSSASPAEWEWYAWIAQAKVNADKEAEKKRKKQLKSRTTN